jgi:small subunit ribosomal protein S21e
MATVGTHNADGENVDMYIPRKCDYSLCLLSASDHAAVQISIGDIDSSGVYTGNTKTLCLAGWLRKEAHADHAVNRLCVTNGTIRPKTGKKKKVSAKKVAAAKARKAAASKGKGGKVAPKAAKKPVAKAKAAPKKDAKKDSKKPAAGDKKAAAPKTEKKPAAKKPAAKKE